MRCGIKVMLVFLGCCHPPSRVDPWLGAISGREMKINNQEMKVWEKNLELNNLCPVCRVSLTCYLTSNCLPTLSAGYSIGASGFKNNEFVNNFIFERKQSRWSQWQKTFSTDNITDWISSLTRLKLIYLIWTKGVCVCD